MKIFYLSMLILFCSISIGYCQKQELQRLIYNDLILINKMFDSSIIKKEDYTVEYQNNFGGVDSTKRLNALKEFKKDITNVNILTIDTISSKILIIKVKFDVKFEDLKEDEIFQYVVYRPFPQKEIYYRVDGFIVNDIFVINRDDLSSASIFYPSLKKVIRRYYLKKRYKKCRKYFKSTIMTALQKEVPYFDNAPIFNSSNFGFSQKR